MSRPKAIATGRLFDACDCYVLDGGVRVLSKRGVVALLSGRESGNLEAYIASLPKRYAYLTAGANFEFVLPGGRIGHAVDARTVVQILVAYDEADDAGELRRQRQRRIARNARRHLRASAEMGLVAMVDEATGYEAIRERGELGRLFRDALGPWEQTFDPELVGRLCALGCAGARYVRWTGGRYPQPLASTFRRIYDLVLWPAAARRMKGLNPEPKRGSNHHQWLTDEAHDLLVKNMAIIRFCAHTSHSRDEFFERLKAHYTGQAYLVYAAG